MQSKKKTEDICRTRLKKARRHIFRIVFEEEDLPNVMRHGEDCPPVQENLDDLVVVRVGRQDERGDVRGEVGRVRGYCLPAL